MTPEERLRAHNAQFEKQVHELVPGAWLAVGYAASNVGMIEGDDGLIIIDTTESTKAAENILAEFRKITDKPVKTIIYTHSHRDHISGAAVFAEGGEVEIIAHPAFASDLVGTEGKPGPHKALMGRTARQFGIGLEFGTERINLGLGPGDRPMEGMGQGFIPPNRPVAQDGELLERQGHKLQIHFAPGECVDSIAIHLPDTGLVFSADNYYASFPNLYAIRGTPYRDFAAWADTLSKIAGLGADVLAPGHTLPLFGAGLIRGVLADYEEAIRFIIEKSAEGMNAGLTPDELVGYVILPDHLRDKPYLQEYYGTVEWAVRAYFAGTIGWFDGDAATLFPLSPADEAERSVALMGGKERVLHEARKALAAGDPQWALELVAKLLRLDGDPAEPRAIRIAAMRALAPAQNNACARNYYLLAAKQEETKTT